MEFLKIKDLEVSVPEKKILKGLSLNINAGEIHVIMGPNGNGKSTLASTIMGDSKYSVDNGTIEFKNKNILEMSVDERARLGIFLAMQYPSELSGITNTQFMKKALEERQEKPLKVMEFFKKTNANAKELEMNNEFLDRFVNVGFSGGEKKRNEIFQMLTLSPDLVILDEIDSGLDIDAIKIVGTSIMKYFEENKERVGILIITHYPRILEYIKPTFVHILKNGKIVKTGDITLANNLEASGYSEV